jgi:cysteine desulfurase/selenocysteine lyase
MSQHNPTTAVTPISSPPGTRVYADWAATSHPKAPGVAEALAVEAARLYSPGRGSYVESLEAGERVSALRKKVAALLGVDDSRRIVFTSGTTDALNMIIQGVLGKALRTLARNVSITSESPVHAVGCGHDHSASLAPLMLMKERGADITLVHPGADYRVSPAQIAAAITPQTKLVTMPLVSNVSGAVQPVEDISNICAQAGVPLLVDAAQAAGHLDLRWMGRADPVASASPNFVVLSAHKGLMGVAGLGMVMFAPGADTYVDPWRVGGVGGAVGAMGEVGATVASLLELPPHLPHRFEAGTVNMLGVAALSAGIDYVMMRGVAALAEHEHNISNRFLSHLDSLPRFTLHGPHQPTGRTPIFSLTHSTIDPPTLAAVLESGFGVLGRSGLLCAPLALAGPSGDARIGRPVLRLSFGALSTLEEVDAAAAALAGVDAMLG